tara:strand:+ start:446 stop:3133 length:2688 start_codon:yes stop_codon:yes gene_type:complete
MPYLAPLVPNLSKEIAKKIFSRITTHRHNLVSSSYSPNSPWKHALQSRVGSSTATELSLPLTEVYNASVIDDIAARFHINPNTKAVSVLDDSGRWNYNARLTSHTGGDSSEALIRMGGHQNYALSDQVVTKIFRDNSLNLQHAIKDSWRLGAYRSYKGFNANDTTVHAVDKMKELTTSMNALKGNGIISSKNFTDFKMAMWRTEDDARREIGQLSVSQATEEAAEAITSRHFTQNFARHKDTMKADALGGVLSRFQVNRHTGKQAGGITRHSLDSVGRAGAAPNAPTIAQVQGSRAIVERGSLSRSQHDIGHSWADWNRYIRNVGQSWSPLIRNAGFLDNQAVARRIDFVGGTYNNYTDYVIRGLGSQTRASLGATGRAYNNTLRQLESGSGGSVGRSAIQTADDLDEAALEAFSIQQTSQPLRGSSTPARVSDKDFLWNEQKAAETAGRAIKENRVDGDPSMLVKLVPKGNKPAATLASISGKPISAKARAAQPSYFGSSQFTNDTSNMAIGDTIGRRIEYQPVRGGAAAERQYIWMDLKRIDSTVPGSGQKSYEFKLSPWRKVKMDDGSEIWSPEVLSGQITPSVGVRHLATKVQKKAGKKIDADGNSVNRIRHKNLTDILTKGSGSDELTYIDMGGSFRNFEQMSAEEQSKMADLFFGLERLSDKKGKNLILNTNSLSSDSMPLMLRMSAMLGAKASVLPNSIWRGGSFFVNKPYKLMRAVNNYGEFGPLTKKLEMGKFYAELLKDGSAMSPITKAIVHRGDPTQAGGLNKLREQLEGFNQYMGLLERASNKSFRQVLGESGKRRVWRMPILDSLLKDGGLQQLTEQNFKQVLKESKRILGKIGSGPGKPDISTISYDKTLMILTRVLPLAFLGGGMVSGQLPVLLPGGEEE